MNISKKKPTVEELLKRIEELEKQPIYPVCTQPHYPCYLPNYYPSLPGIPYPNTWPPQYTTITFAC